MDGLKNYYNFLRPHMALKNETPAEKANLNLELGRNGWLSIIRKGVIARRRNKKNPKPFYPSSLVNATEPAPKI